jgi:hypothetical protein
MLTEVAVNEPLLAFEPSTVTQLPTTTAESLATSVLV